MTALSPTPNGTGHTAPIVLPATPDRRSRVRDDRGTPPAWAQLTAAIIATSFVWVAVDVTLAGWLWAGLPLLALGTAVFAGAVLPDVLADRWDAQRAVQDAEDALEAADTVAA